MVFEADAFFLLPASILNIQNAYKVSSPASDKAVEYLEHDSRNHSELRKRVWKREQHLRNLSNKKKN